MFTPQRKGRAGSGWQENGSVSRANPRSSLGVVLGRGKDVIGADETPVPPPQGFLGEKDGERAGTGAGGSSSEDWKRFREAGLLDEKVQLRKDRDVLTERVSALEIERDECLYNMGLLLIEKNEWSSQIEELRQALAEAQEFLKREQSAHIMAISESEKREDNLKKALGIEKQCVLDLEKALHEMRAEVSETKFLSENKLANAHALEASLEEKRLEIESKVHAADARLAETNRKNSEMERKLDELEAREHKVQRELSSLHSERKALEKDLSKQREHLLEWEKELQEKQRRLLEEQRLLNEREERANEADMILKKKEGEIEEGRRRIDASNNALKIQEDDYKARLRALSAKEKAAESKSSQLVKKEKDLIAVEEKLNAREREEIQKLLDEHNAILDAKKQDFELEMAKKRRSFDDEAKTHMEMLNKDRNIVKLKEEQLRKREEELEIKTENIKSKEKDADSKSKVLKKWEDSLKTDEKSLQEQRKQLLEDSDRIEASRAKLRDEKAAIEAELLKLVSEKEKLKITREEKERHLKLQAELKHEKDECRMMMESLEKQKEALRQEREMFEREWEVLDERRAALEADMKRLSAEREKLENWQHNEEERLKHECLEARAVVKRELEDLTLKKESFAKMMAQERNGHRADIDKERADMSREFDLMKHDLEMSLQRRQDEAEKQFQEKKNEFERWREVELSRIKSLNESNDLELRRLEMQQNQLLREKEELSDQKQKLESDRREIQKDIDTLLRLSESLKHQREEFAKEREMFLSTAARCKTCHNCGVSINNFDLDLQPLGAAEDSEVPLPSLTDGFLEEHLKDGSPVAGSTNSGSHMKRWLQRCANLFKVSPRNNMNASAEGQTETSLGERFDRTGLEDADYEPAPSASFENQMVHFDGGDMETGELDREENAEDDAEASFGGANSFVDIVRAEIDDGAREIAPVNDEKNDKAEGFSMQDEKDLYGSSKEVRPQRRQPSRKAKSKKIRRTHSVIAVVEDAKTILGESYELYNGKRQNGDPKDLQNILEESAEAPAKADQAGKNKKRRSIEVEPEVSEALSESASIGGRPKKKSTSSQQTTGDKRYNFRRSTVASSAAATHDSSHQIRAAIAGNSQQPQESNERGGGQPVSNEVEDSQPLSKEVEDSQPLSKEVEDSQPLSNEVEHGQLVSNSMEGQPQGNSLKSAVQSIMEVETEKLVQHENQEEINYDQIHENVNEVDAENSTIFKPIEFGEHIADDDDEVNGDNNAIKSADLSEQFAEDGDEIDADTACTPSDSVSGTDEEDEEDEFSGKRTASLGKKLWHFFTT